MNIKHKLTFSAILACMAMASPVMAEVVEVGTGTYSDTSYPYGINYRYSTTQTIYTASEIGGAMDIEAIAYYVTSAGALQTSSVEIYMGHTTKASFSSGYDYLPVSSMTLVYSGAPTLGAKYGWEVLSLTTPFAYNGTDNLMVMVCKKASSYTSAKYYYSSTSSSQCLFRADDFNSSYGDATYTSNYSARYYKANIQFLSNLFEHDGLRYVTTSDNEAMVMGSTIDNGEVTIPSSVNYDDKEYSITCIGDYVFYGCSGLTSINLPSSLTSIGSYAFYGCSGLTSINLPSSLTSIGDYAFQNCI